MRQEITKLLEIGAIRKCKFSEDHFLSPIFLVPKPNGTWRFILNLKKFNSFVQTFHFKMEDIRTAIKLLFPNFFMAKIDLKDAYLMIPLDESSTKFFRFLFEDEFYEFLVTPFGFCEAPRIFTKLMKVAVNFLRQKGFTIVVYLDDILCIGSTYDECLKTAKATLEFLQSLGWLINWEKSFLTPSKTCEFLGLVLNSEKMVLELPLAKKQNLAEIIEKFSLLNHCQIQEFASFLGKLVAACPAIRYSWVYTKFFERQKFQALLANNNNYEGKMYLPKYLQSDFDWWKKSILTGFQPIQNSNFDFELFTDASLSGWGASLVNGKTNGSWNADEASLHINMLELLAILYALKSFFNNKSDIRILLRVDNTTAIAYVNKMGGIQYPNLNSVARQIWQWCEARNIWIWATYIKSSENIEADKQSRVKNIDTEWSLNSHAFSKITKTFGFPDIDLFASRCNNKCYQFCSRYPDPDCFQVDAFSISWSQYFFYAFPPFALILRMLRKIIEEKSEGIVVVPCWPAQPWFPLFKKLIVGNPITFDPDDKLLLSPYSRSPHPLAQNLSLIVAVLSGRRMCYKD